MRTRATLRSAEFGFFGVVVKTRVQTPRRWGAVTFFLRPLPDFRPGVASFFVLALRPFRTSWLVVGMRREMVAACLRAAPTQRERSPRRGECLDELASAEREPELDAVARAGEVASGELLHLAHPVAQRVAVAEQPARCGLPLPVALDERLEGADE